MSRRDPNRFRPHAEQMEDRTVPTPVVTINWVSDATEGDPANYRAYLSRSEADFSSLTVNLAYSGTATAGSDYTAPSTVTFAPGASTVTLGFAATDDTVSEPTETVVIAVQSGTGYTVGTASSTTVNIFDNDLQYVSVAKVNDATEGGADGTFRFTRSGDLSSSLTANYTVGGTATSGTDYTALSGTVTFAAGAATADVTVAASTDAIYDPDESVSVTVGSGTGYSVGSPSSAEVSITDESSTVQTLIHQETFHLSGSGAGVDVTLTVTYNAPGAEGLYTWIYTVSNPSSNTTSLTNFTVPIDGMDTDVADLASSIGWTGSVGTDLVSWTAGTGLSPGSSATFSFTTDLREVGDGDISAGGGGGFLADLPTAPAPHAKILAPQVNVSLGGTGQTYDLTLELTAADGTTLQSGVMEVRASTAETARDFIYIFLKNNGWAVEKAGTTGLTILGKVGANNTILAVKSFQYKVENRADTSVPPTFSKYGSVDLSELP